MSAAERAERAAEILARLGALERDATDPARPGRWLPGDALRAFERELRGDWGEISSLLRAAYLERIDPAAELLARRDELLRGSKRCASCAETRPGVEFYVRDDGTVRGLRLSSWCRTCSIRRAGERRKLERTAEGRSESGGGARTGTARFRSTGGSPRGGSGGAD